MITNKEIKLLKSLSQKKYRYKYKQFLIEGLRIVEELIRSNHKPLKIWMTEEVLNKNQEFKKNITKFDHEVISQKYFSQTLDTQNPQHIMALLPIDSKDVLRLVGQNILVLDGVSDPGNMGSLLRSAVWYGIDSIICSNECVDIYNPKVVRAAMGAHFYIKNIMHMNLIDILRKLKKQQYNIIGAALEGISHKKIKINANPWCLILGSEAHGISNDLYPFINQKFFISQNKSSIESLNVSIAGSILLDRLINK